MIGNKIKNRQDYYYSVVRESASSLKCHVRLHLISFREIMLLLDVTRVVMETMLSPVPDLSLQGKAE